MPAPETDAERTAAAAQAYHASLPPDQAQTIQALPPEKQLAALDKLASQDTASPWPSHDQLTGQRNPLDVIDWNVISLPTSTSQHG